MSVKRLTKLLRDERIDVFPGQPVRAGGAVARGGGEAPHRQERPLSQLGVNPARQRGRRVSTSGTGCGVLSCYHSTETGPISLDRAGKDPATVGKPYPGVELRLGSGDSAGARR